MKDTSNRNCSVMLDVLQAHGVNTIVLSPGSRNAPILIGCAGREDLKKIIINDERTAAFTALGIGMITRKPVALACTSGTALYNYAPAVAEAYYQHIPLIVITADRPAQWIDQDDSQTLRQFRALDNIVKRSYDLYEETGMAAKCANPEYESEREWFVNRVVNEAVLTASSAAPGPVHINIQFGNPLNGIEEREVTGVRTVRRISNPAGLPPHISKEIAETLLEKKVMVVAGFMAPDNKLNKSLAAFSALPNVTVLCEPLSNLHLEGHAYMVDSLLTNMSESEKERMRPDVVITIGGALVSRMLKEYLRGCLGTEHWTLADTDVSVDCFQRLTTHIDVTPERFFSATASMMRHLIRKGKKCACDDFRAEWQKKRDAAFSESRELIKGYGWSELKAFDKLFGRLPQSFNLFLSNGTSIRYAHLLLDRLPHGCYCNRGVSGIEGTNATAYGASLAYGGPTLLVTGDVSFSYCPQIMNLCDEKSNLRIVVINNCGGGIFRFIRTTRELDIREEYFCSPQDLRIEGLCKAYGWNYLCARNEEELGEGLDSLFASPRTLLEIQVDTEESAEILINYLSNKK